jgi:hypothetical protein
MVPMQSRLSTDTWAKGVAVFRKRMEEILEDPPFDAERWLKGDLAGALSGAESREQLDKVKDTVLIPEKDKLSAAQWKTAVRMYRERLDEIDPANALAGG